MPDGVTVAPADGNGPGTARFTVTMRVRDVAALRKTPDPTVELSQGGHPRDFLAEEKGRILLTSATGVQLRLPAAVAVRPASMTRASDELSSTLTAGSSSGSTGVLQLRGTPVSNGPLGKPDSVDSPIGGFQLQARSPRLLACSATQLNQCLHFPSQRAGDLQYGGASSTGADPTKGVVGIALTTYGSWISPAVFDVAHPTVKLTEPQLPAAAGVDALSLPSPDFQSHWASAPTTRRRAPRIWGRSCCTCTTGMLTRPRVSRSSEGAGSAANERALARFPVPAKSPPPAGTGSLAGDRRATPCRLLRVRRPFSSVGRASPW